jgi:hypothetical protein
MIGRIGRQSKTVELATIEKNTIENKKTLKQVRD